MAAPSADISLCKLPAEVLRHVAARLPTPEDLACLAQTTTLLRQMFHSRYERVKFSLRWSCSSLCTLQWAHGHGLNLNRLEIFKEFEGDRDEDDEGVRSVMECVAFNGNQAALEWLIVHKGMSLSDAPLTLVAAARGGHLHMLEWLLSTHVCVGDREWRTDPVFHALVYSYGPLVCSAAAAGGHLRVLQFCREKGIPWGHSTPSSAARGGHLAVLRWAFQHGCRVDRRLVCHIAARRGDVNVLQWALDQGFPVLDRWVCSAAAAGGHLELLQWLRERGAPWDKWTILKAARGQHVTVLEWARANGCPEPSREEEIAILQTEGPGWPVADDL